MQHEPQCDVGNADGHQHLPYAMLLSQATRSKLIYDTTMTPACGKLL
jgi:hypothetical protein